MQNSDCCRCRFRSPRSTCRWWRRLRNRQGTRSRRGFRAARLIIAPGVAPPKKQSNEQCRNTQHKSKGNPFRWGGDGVVSVLGRGRSLRAMRQVVLGQERLFIEAQVAGDRPDESAVKNAPGKFFPLFVF